jgi:hypothetical protein
MPPGGSEERRLKSRTGRRTLSRARERVGRVRRCVRTDREGCTAAGRGERGGRAAGNDDGRTNRDGGEKRWTVRTKVRLSGMKHCDNSESENEPF